MTEVVQKTEKQVKFDQWLEELRSGNYVQANGGLRIDDHGTPTYCCVGVLNEKIYGTGWHPPSDKYLDVDFVVYADDTGETQLMSADRVKDMDLDKYLTDDEVDYFADMGVVYHVRKRINMLAQLNDEGHTFESIADYIEELGWNND